uniref:Putative secreted protein n=1 Tax=Anopheles darlingi TaxID=43151 RepID=A0A2M4DEK1_ANODA
MLLLVAAVVGCCECTVMMSPSVGLIATSLIWECSTLTGLGISRTYAKLLASQMTAQPSIDTLTTIRNSIDNRIALIGARCFSSRIG